VPKIDERDGQDATLASCWQELMYHTITLIVLEQARFVVSGDVNDWRLRQG
jgi:hypothetical protein